MSNVNYQAGQKLREVRDDVYGLTMADVERKTRDLFGEGQEMKSPQIHRIEKGKLTRPPSIEDLAKLAYVYHMSPTQMFELYGLPVFKRDDPLATDSRIVRVENLVAKLQPGDPIRERLLDFINFSVRQAQGELEQREEQATHARVAGDPRRG